MGDTVQIDITVPNSTAYLSLVGRIGEELARTVTHCNSQREVLAYELNTILTEAMTNVIFHANRNDPESRIDISIRAGSDRIVIRFFDTGQGFDDARRACLNPVCPDPYSEQGRGIFIIRSLVDSVTYRTVKGRHIFEMIKHLHPRPPS